MSPLLQGYAESEVGEAGLKNFNRMVGYGWFLQRTLTPPQFLHLTSCALATKEQFLIGHIAYHVISMDRQRIQRVAKELCAVAALP